MSTLVIREIVGPDDTAPVFTHGLIIGQGNAWGVDHIGTPGGPAFGVGICPAAVVPVGMYALAGHDNPMSAYTGNYQYADGSVMAYIPPFWEKWGDGSNGFALNWLDIKPLSHFADVSAANAAGYAMDRAFYDGGAIKGVFVDKFLCSNNNGIASSIQNGAPLTSSAAHNPFSGLTGSPANAYYGAIDAVKTRGANFFCASVFIYKMLARLAYAHAQASSNATFCAWYDSTLSAPRGCNNNALGDAYDASIAYVSDSYAACGRTGSANYPARTAHNGQLNGVYDLAGPLWQIAPGITSDGANYHVLKTSTRMRDVTSGNSGSADLWGPAGISALYDNAGSSWGAATGASRYVTIGAVDQQVFSNATSGIDWQMAGAGIPLANGIGGSNRFGNDGFWDYRPNEMCPIVCGGWYYASLAGVWALTLYFVRGDSNDYVGCRAALYP